MRFKIQPTPDETQRACAAIASTSFPPSRLGMVSNVIFAVVGLSGYLLIGSIWAIAITILLTSAGVLAVTLAMQAEARWSSRRAQESDPHADEPYEIEVGPNGIRVWCAHVDSHYTWDGITRVSETPEFYLFLSGPSGGPFIPKRLLDAKSNEELRKGIREWSPELRQSLNGE
jgi:hypothetical protein